MRVFWGTLVILSMAHGICDGQTQLSVSAGTLVREVVYNELNDHHTHRYWRYWVQHNTANETRVDNQVETSQGPVTLLASSNGRTPTPEAEEQEGLRLRRLLNSPDERTRHLREFEEDENRIGRILALLPDAFAYEYEGDENGCHHLSFHPNPEYTARSIEARIFHAMSGELWVDARMKRLVRLDAHVTDNVDFGYGILGRLYKGGWFQLIRTQVSPTDWKTQRLEVHMCGRALFVKSFARDTSEERGGFRQVSSGMDLARGIALLRQADRVNEAETQAPVQFQIEVPMRSSELGSSNLPGHP
jgi:hypothetical protein